MRDRYPVASDVLGKAELADAKGEYRGERPVAHERSFSAAARELALTQPAVSQQVAALEREVGAKLLDREPGGFAGVVALDADTKVAAGLVLASSSRTDLRQLVRFAREHLK